MKPVLEAAPDEKAPTRRVFFFDLPAYRLALHHLDGWGYVELGASTRVVARYKHFATHGQAQGWPVEPVLLHAVVERVLGARGTPPVFRAYLRHRYPRQEGVHRGSLDAFHHPALERVMDWTGATEGMVGELLLSTEKAFVRELARKLA